MQARVRFGCVAGNPLRRSCVARARNATGPREVQHKIRVRAGIGFPRIYLTHALLKTGSIFKLGRDVGLQEPNLVHWNAVEPIHQIQGHCPFFVTLIHHPHISTTISHLRTHTVTPSHPPSLFLSFPPSLFLSFFLSFYISFLSPLYMYIFARSHVQIYLSTSTHLHIYIAAAHLHCHSFTSALSFSLSIYLFDSTGQSHVLLSGELKSLSLELLDRNVVCSQVAVLVLSRACPQEWS